MHILALLLVGVAVFGTPATAMTQMAAPHLRIAVPAEEPVSLRSVAIRTEITGSLALTTVELAFFNPNRRQLEGELQFPLQDGAQVVGMAMDVDGRLREAVPVEKARGEAIFEDITRAQIDPALLSATQGNSYKLRVYPILPQRDKTVVLRYLETLPARDGRFAYRVPLNYAQPPAPLSIAVRVIGAPAAPTAVAGVLGRPAFVRDGEAHVLEVTRRDFARQGGLGIEIPVGRAPGVHTQLRDGATYFHAEIPLAEARAPRPLPRVIDLAWDSSGSGRARDHGRELALLDAYFAKVGNAEVRLVRIRDAAEPARHFAVAGGDWRALRKALEATAYDGATALGAFEPDPNADEVLLFSDGLGNFGARRLPVFTVPVYAVSASPRADAALLRHAAQASGGRFIDLEAATDREAADALLTETSRIAALEGDGVAQLVAASPYPERRRLAVAGVLTRSSGSVRVTVSHPDGRRQVVAFPVDAHRNAGALAASLWARYRIAELESDYELHRAEIGRLGKAFGVVTRETSLIVLDRVEDYARHEIAPPAELADAYRSLRAKLAERAATDQRVQLERVVRMFEEKAAWWEREFPKGPKPAQIAAKAASALHGSIASLRMAPGGARRAREEDGTGPAPAPRLPASEPAQVAEQRALADMAHANASRRDGPEAPVATIRLRRWIPDAPYVARLRDATPDDLYGAYLDERTRYSDSTAFFLDAADLFFERGRADLGVRVLSNLAELDLENRHVLRILGLRLVQAGQPELALPVFRKVLELAPGEPQSYRDLGLAQAAARHYQAAIDALREVIVRPWHDRFPEIELITLAEINAIVATCGEKLDTSRIDPRLLKNLPLDLRVVLTWDADNTDIDLWVTDPNGERAFYGNRLTYQGGRMSRDFTGGYGPEEFSLRSAKPGRYRVEAHYYGNRQQVIAGATTLQLRLATGFGTAKQKEQAVTLRLKDRQEVVFVGEFEVAPGE